ncbi:MAG: hypothetical protein HYW48_06855 [Deltaproteobacteria bacterium]|nr:hypothetical protein [Deltaproteobacteria bacterium]
MGVSLEQIITFFVSPTFVWLWCVATLLYAFYWGLSLYWEGANLKSQLWEALRIIKGFSSPKAFAERFVDVDAKVMMLAKLRTPWQDFVNQLAFTETPRPTKISFTPPDACFNEERLIEPTLSSQTYGMIPTQLGGLGILGTFCGLASGVYVARTGFAGGDLNQLQASLYQLLGGSSLAFWTSIVGMASGLCFAKLEKAQIETIQALIKRMNTLLRNRVDVVSSSQLTHSQMLLSQESQVVLKQIQEHLAHSRQEKELALSEWVQQAMESFRTALFKTSWNEIKSMQDAMRNIYSDKENVLALLAEQKDVLKNFASFLTKMETLARSLETTQVLCGQWVSISQNLHSTVTEIRDVQNKVSQQWENYCTRFEGVDKSLAAAFQNTNDSILAYTDKFKNLTREFDKHMSRGMHSLAGAIGDLQQVVGNLPKKSPKGTETLAKKSSSLI